MVHSCLYYEMDTSLISDHQFDAWCNELVKLMKEHPDAYNDEFDHYFNGWKGESGYHFPHRHPWVYDRALNIFKISEAMKDE